MLNFAYKYFLRKLLFLFNPEIAHMLIENLLYFFPNNLFKLLFGYKFNPNTAIKLFNNEIPSPIKRSPMRKKDLILMVLMDLILLASGMSS